MIIVIAGIKRSGSTAQYNMVRLILEHAGYEVIPFGHTYNANKGPKQGQAHLIKRHPFNQGIAMQADHVFLTDRNDNDIIKSLNRMWDSGSKKRLKNMRKHLEKWECYTDINHHFHYENLIDYKRSIERIIDVLDVDVDSDSVLEAFLDIKPPVNKQDPVTLLFPDHVSA